MNKFFGHFRTITRHRHQVIRNCARCGLLWQGLRHDLSKYSPVEFFAGVRYYTGKKSPNEGERAEMGYSLAWMHHKGRNRHHFEYWTDLNPVTHRIEPVKMPLRFVAEMFCDRVAASKIYMGEAYHDAAPLNYYINGCAKKYIHPETSVFLEGLLRRLAENGEEDTFAYVRRYCREHGDY